MEFPSAIPRALAPKVSKKLALVEEGRAASEKRRASRRQEVLRCRNKLLALRKESIIQHTSR
jgi:hypothetical protein